MIQAPDRLLEVLLQLQQLLGELLQARFGGRAAFNRHTAGTVHHRIQLLTQA
jgi:hypothetical protein